MQAVSLKAGIQLQADISPVARRELLAVALAVSYAELLNEVGADGNPLLHKHLR